MGIKNNTWLNHNIKSHNFYEIKSTHNVPEIQNNGKKDYNNPII